MEKDPLDLKYRSGQEIKGGDRVLYFGNAAEIELVACSADDPEAEWFINEFGGGIMILDPKVSGRTFIPANMIVDAHELEFVSRADQK